MQSHFSEICQRLGGRLTVLRKQMKLSQEELAFRAGIDRTYVSQMERGVCNPSVLVLIKVADVLEVDVEEFFRSQESGVRSQESGVRSQESGVRSQESGARAEK